MIVNLQPEVKTNLEVRLQKLRNAPFQFYLTGSRFFGHAKPNSDWDFFTADRVDARNFLKELDFLELNTEEIQESYRDALGTCSIYRYVDKSGQIDVQLIQFDWLDYKIKVNNLIKNLAICLKWAEMSKNAQRTVWSSLFSIMT